MSGSPSGLRSRRPRKQTAASREKGKYVKPSSRSGRRLRKGITDLTHIMHNAKADELAKDACNDHKIEIVDVLTAHDRAAITDAMQEHIINAGAY